MSRVRITHYFDYKSPYAYLAQEATWQLSALPGVSVEWVPYTLQIDKYLGVAELGEDGRDTVGTRNDHQWRRVRYSYMDCRREASRRGLIVRGPRRIFDSSFAHIAFLFAREQGDFRRFHDRLFELFWRRELDVEDIGQLRTLLVDCDFELDGFDRYLTGEGRALHDTLQMQAEAAGVFGVPSWIVGDELYWGQERLERVYEHLGQKPAATEHEDSAA